MTVFIIPIVTGGVCKLLDFSATLQQSPCEQQVVSIVNINDKGVGEWGFCDVKVLLWVSCLDKNKIQASQKSINRAQHQLMGI